MILQGYDLTTAKYKANLYQKRMMLAVVSAAQSKIDGVRHIAGQRFKIEEGEFPIISVPIDLILQDDDSSNIFAVRKAAKDFIGRVIEYQAADGSWVVFSPIITATIPRYGSVVQLQVHKLFWEAILDYRSGYRKLDVKRAIALKSVYAIRFYELFSGKTEPIIYPVAKLKEMFAIKDKYKQINDFVRKVIEPAKRELDAAAPYSFDFEPVKDGRKIIAFKFTPLHYPQRENEDAEVRDLQRKLLSLGYPRPPCPRLSKTPSDSPKLKSRTISRCSEGHRNYCRIYSPSLLFSRGKAETRTIPKDGLFAP